MEQYFQYGEKEIAYLKGKDKRLADMIDKIGLVKRRVIPDLFPALVHSIIGQQISTKAHETVWQKLVSSLENITPEKILDLSPEALQAFGMTFKKVEYIRNAAQQIVSGEFDMQALHTMNDAEVCKCLSELKGIGVWSVECRNADAFLHATTRYIELRRPCHTTWIAHDLPPSDYRPQII